MPTQNMTTQNMTTQNHRSTALLVGLLFLLATATFATSHNLLAPVMNPFTPLSSLPAQGSKVVAAALLALLDGFCVVGIAAWLWPVLRRHHPALALGYFGVRVTELGVIVLLVLAPLLLLSLSKHQNPTSDPGVAQLLTGLHDWTLQLIYLLNGVAGWMLCTIFLRSRLVPAALSHLGLFGYVLLLVASVLGMLGVLNLNQGVGLLALLPGGLFELLLPLWLMVRGFSAERWDPDPSHAERPASR